MHPRTRLRGKAGGLLLGHLGGIPVFLHATCLVGWALVITVLASAYGQARETDEGSSSEWVARGVALVLFYPSVLLHEVAHVVMARRKKVEISSITLFALSGHSEAPIEPEDPAAELAIVAAGPASSLAIAGLCFSLGRVNALGDTWVRAATLLAAMNLAVAVLNLVPVFPLDGARILRAIFWRAWGKAEATLFMADFSKWTSAFFFGLGVVAAFRGFWLPAGGLLLLGWSFSLGIQRALWQLHFASALQNGRARDAMVVEVVSVPAQLSLAEVKSEYLDRFPYRAFPVVRGEAVIGLFVRSLLARRRADALSSSTVQSAMIPLDPRVTVAPEETLEAALRKVHNRTGCVLVVEEGRLRGLLRASSIESYIGGIIAASGSTRRR